MFQSKLTDSDGEAAETQVWLEFAVKCGYLARDKAAQLYQEYDGILKTLVGMVKHRESWTFPNKSKSTK